MPTSFGERYYDLMILYATLLFLGLAQIITSKSFNELANSLEAINFLKASLLLCIFAIIIAVPFNSFQEELKAFLTLNRWGADFSLILFFISLVYFYISVLYISGIRIFSLDAFHLLLIGIAIASTLQIFARLLKIALSKKVKKGKKKALKTIDWRLYFYLSTVILISALSSLISCLFRI
jgi:hypothetical protein